MYYLSKFVWFFLEPSNFLIILALAGWFSLRRRPRLGRAMIGIALGGLIFCGFSPLGTLALGQLEQRFPAFADDGRPVAGAIILGGAVDPEVTSVRGQLALNEAAERITALVELHRRYPQARLVFTGGSGELLGIISEADAIETFSGGLMGDATILYERAARNTVENAEMTHRLVAPKPGERWLLVTSAWHMPRSMGIFRKAGWDVTAFPVDFRTTGDSRDWRPFSGLAIGLRRVDLAAKEWVGLLFAYLTGKTPAVFPQP